MVMKRKRSRILKAYHAYQMDQINEERRKNTSIRPKTGQHTYIKKKGLVHKQNKGYKMKVRVSQYIKDATNHNQEPKMAKQASK